MLIAPFSNVRIGVPSKANSLAIFDILVVRTKFVETDGQRYLQDAINTIFSRKDFSDQNRDLELFFKEHVGEELQKSFYISYWSDKFLRYSKHWFEIPHRSNFTKSKTLFEE